MNTVSAVSVREQNIKFGGYINVAFTPAMDKHLRKKAEFEQNHSRYRSGVARLIQEHLTKVFRNTERPSIMLGGKRVYAGVADCDMAKTLLIPREYALNSKTHVLAVAGKEYICVAKPDGVDLFYTDDTNSEFDRNQTNEKIGQLVSSMFSKISINGKKLSKGLVKISQNNAFQINDRDELKGVQDDLKKQHHFTWEPLFYRDMQELWFWLKGINPAFPASNLN